MASVGGVVRLINDVPHIVNGTVPAEDIDRGYVAHPWIAYFHIAPAIWMIRAYAIGIGVGTKRIWVFICTGPGLLDFPDSFAVAFWLSFTMHALFAESWIRTAPHPLG